MENKPKNFWETAKEMRDDREKETEADRIKRILGLGQTQNVAAAIDAQKNGGGAKGGCCGK